MRTQRLRTNPGFHLKIIIWNLILTILSNFIQNFNANVGNGLTVVFYCGTPDFDFLPGDTETPICFSVRITLSNCISIGKVPRIRRPKVMHMHAAFDINSLMFQGMTLCAYLYWKTWTSYLPYKLNFTGVVFWIRTVPVPLTRVRFNFSPLATYSSRSIVTSPNGSSRRRLSTSRTSNFNF